MTSWKTTVSGIALLLVQIGNAVVAITSGNPVNVLELVTSIVTGIGLIAAKDSNVTGGTVQMPKK